MGSSSTARHRLRTVAGEAEPWRLASSLANGSGVQPDATASVLLTEPSHCGTLAAARSLGSLGLTVWTAGESRFHIAARSRHVDQHWMQPRLRDPAAQVAWLEDFGHRHSGTILYPTSDDQAWLQAQFAPRLTPHYRTYAPAVTTVEAVLDKMQLYEACLRAGIEVPVTHFAESRAQVELIARTAKFPLLLKQRTQILSRTKTKGVLVSSPQQLLAAYPRFVAANPHAPQVQRRMPFASWPLVQEFHPDARDGSYVISGFVNRTYTEFAALAAVKVLQYPRTLGIALCIESAPLDEALLRRILALCKLTGHFGVFQVEFLVAYGRKLLIDFNPRYYHYMGFDIARGLPLPWLACLGALGDEDRLALALRSARSIAATGPSAFTYRLQLRELLWAQQLSGRMSLRDVRHWRAWIRQQRNLIDAVADPEDRGPEIAAAAAGVWSLLRHPRVFVRQIMLDR